MSVLIRLQDKLLDQISCQLTSMSLCGCFLHTSFLLVVFSVQWDGIFGRDFVHDPLIANKITTKNKLTSMDSHSAMNCATKCSVYPQCVSFFYNRDRSLCQLHDLVLTLQNSASNTDDPGTRYYHPAEDCMTEAHLYTGSVSVTKTGRTCQSWRVNNPHKVNGYSDINNFPDDSFTGMDNHCRAPTEPNGYIADETWCYTTDPGKQWEYCDVPVCPGFTPP